MILFLQAQVMPRIGFEVHEIPPLLAMVQEKIGSRIVPAWNVSVFA